MCSRSRLALCTPPFSGSRKKGWVTAKWGQTDANQRAKFYRLTPDGKRQLLREASRWTELVNAIGQVMNPVPARGTEE
jgi:DNA-binding PadR family transcriptional regulator